MPPHETHNPRVTSKPPAETGAPSHVSAKNYPQATSDLRNSYDYTQDIECINLEGHSEHTNDDDGLVPLHDIFSYTQISVSSKYKHIDSVATSIKSSMLYQDK